MPCHTVMFFPVPVTSQKFKELLTPVLPLRTPGEKKANERTSITSPRPRCLLTIERAVPLRLSYLILTTSLGVTLMLTPILQMRKLRTRETL